MAYLDLFTTLPMLVVQTKRIILEMKNSWENLSSDKLMVFKCQFSPECLHSLLCVADACCAWSLARSCLVSHSFPRALLCTSHRTVSQVCTVSCSHLLSCAFFTSFMLSVLLSLSQKYVVLWYVPSWKIGYSSLITEK